MAEIATLSVLLQARDQLSGPLGKMQGTLDNVAAKARKMGLALTAMGGAITGVTALSVKSFVAFEQAIANTGAVSNATAAEMDDLTKVAKEMGRTTVFTATESAKALSFLAMAGFNVKESTQALPGVLNLAAAAQIDLAQAADITSNVLSGYGFQVEQLSRVNDVLAKAFTSANTDLVQLGEAMKLAGPVASAAGIRFEESAASLALMGNAGFQASLAGTALRGAITRMLTPTAAMEDVMQKLGVSFTDSRGELLPLVDIVAKLEKSGMSAGDAMQIFGQRAGPAMLALISQGSEALQTMTGELNNAGGTADDISRRQLDTLGGQLKLLKSAVDGLAIELGTVLAPVIRAAAEKISAIAGAISDWAKEHPRLAKFMAIATAAIGALMLVLGSLLLILPAIGAAMSLMLGPVGVVIVAIGALTAGAIALWKNWDFVWANMKKITETAVNFVIGLFNTMTFVHRNALAGMIDIAKKFIDAIPGSNPLGDSMEKAAASIRAGIPDIDITAEKIKTMAFEYDGAGGVVDEATTDMKQSFADLAGSAETEFPKIAAAAADFTGKMASLLSRQMQDAIDARKGILADLIDSSQEGQLALKEDAAERTAIAEDINAKFISLTKRQRDDAMSIDDERMAALIANSKIVQAALDEQGKAADRLNRTFDDQTHSIVFNLSDQGQAWRNLGSSAQGVIDAMSQTMGTAAKSIIDELKGMAIEGESWKDLLLRLDTEGKINLQNLAEEFKALTKDVNETGRAIAELSAAEVLSARRRELSGQQSAVEAQILQNLAAGVDVNALALVASQIGSAQSSLPGMAHGGRVTSPGLAIVGERGPEIMRFPTGATVAPLGRGGMGGATVNVTNHFHGDIIGVDDLDRRIVRTVRDKALAGGFIGTPLVN